MNTHLPLVRCRDCGTLLGPGNRHGYCQACSDCNEATEVDLWNYESASERSYRADDPYERQPWWEEL